MSKALAEYYQEKDLMSRVDMSYANFKMLEAEYEMSLVKHFSPSDKEFFRQDPQWKALNQTISECYQELSERESELRVNQTVK